MESGLVTGLANQGKHFRPEALYGTHGLANRGTSYLNAKDHRLDAHLGVLDKFPGTLFGATDDERQLPRVTTTAQFVCDPLKRTFELVVEVVVHPLRPGRATGVEDL